MNIVKGIMFTMNFNTEAEQVVKKSLCVVKDIQKNIQWSKFWGTCNTYS